MRRNSTLIALLALCGVLLTLPAATASTSSGTMLAQGTAPRMTKPEPDGKSALIKKKVSGTYRMTATKEKVSGLNLMVIAYCMIWLIIFGYMFVLRRTQKKMDKDLGDLQARLAEFEAK